MKSNYNYQTNKVNCKIGEKSTQPSKTIPDDTFSIPELIKRYASGQSLGGGRTPIFDEEPENDLLQGRPFASFDLSEQHEIVKAAKAEYQETIDRLRNNQKTAGVSTDKVETTAESKSSEA